MARSKRRHPQTTGATVDVVMPVYGGPELLAECLRTLRDHDAGVAYTLTLVDDASPQQEELWHAFAFAQEQMGATILSNHKNVGFAATCNRGARSGKEPWILLLNTDVRIRHDGWLKALVEEGRDPQVGVVGCLLTFFEERDDDPFTRPAGKVQHAGVVFDILGRPYHIFSGWNPDHPKVQQRREMNCVTGACLLARRALWRRLGGLDEAYTRGNFEDVQFCIQARLARYKVVYTPKTRLDHFAGGSHNSMTAERNARLFQLKMGQLVEYDEWRYW